MTDPTTDDLECREVVEVVTDYLEGAMPPGERLRFEPMALIQLPTLAYGVSPMRGWTSPVSTPGTEPSGYSAVASPRSRSVAPATPPACSRSTSTARSP